MFSHLYYLDDFSSVVDATASMRISGRPTIHIVSVHGGGAPGARVARQRAVESGQG